MRIKLYRGLVFFIAFVQLSYGLEVTRNMEYYLVNPNNYGSVFDSIHASAGVYTKGRAGVFSTNKTLGEYTPKIDFDITYSVDFLQRCFVSSANIFLASSFILPKLDPTGEYSGFIQREFGREYDKIYNHEAYHEETYIDLLTNLEKEILAVGRKKTNCTNLKATIAKLEEATLKKLDQINLEFDCKEYAKALGVAECG